MSYESGAKSTSTVPMPRPLIGKLQTLKSLSNGVPTLAPLAPVPESTRSLASTPSAEHPYGDGGAGYRIAQLLAELDPHEPSLNRKRCVY